MTALQIGSAVHDPALEQAVDALNDALDERYSPSCQPHLQHTSGNAPPRHSAKRVGSVACEVTALDDQSMDTPTEQHPTRVLFQRQREALPSACVQRRPASNVVYHANPARPKRR